MVAQQAICAGVRSSAMTHSADTMAARARINPQITGRVWRRRADRINRFILALVPAGVKRPPTT